MPIKPLIALAAMLAAAPLAAQTPIRVGDIVNGTLAEGSALMEDSAYYDAYLVRGAPGERVIVQMTSADFDPYLFVGPPRGGEWEEEDDDSGTSERPARLAVRLDGDGAYGVRAVGYLEGAYRLRVLVADPPPVPIRVRQTIEGELTPADHEREEGLEDHYVIRGTPGGVATVTATSGEFDPYLQMGPWQDGDLDPWDTDDDSGLGTQALMFLRFDDDAEYRIVVGSFNGTGTGRYTLRIVEGLVGGCDGGSVFQQKDDVASPAGCPPLP